MPAFTYTPSFEATEASKPRARKFQAGDGYEQRIRFGLNTNPKALEASACCRACAKPPTVCIEAASMPCTAWGAVCNSRGCIPDPCSNRTTARRGRASTLTRCWPTSSACRPTNSPVSPRKE